MDDDDIDQCAHCPHRFYANVVRGNDGRVPLHYTLVSDDDPPKVGLCSGSNLPPRGDAT